jgi:hypothetical protein
MPVVETDTKRQMIEKLDTVPPEKLRSVLECVKFISLDEDKREWLLEPDDLTDGERELVQEALQDPRPDVPHSQIRKMLGM